MVPLKILEEKGKKGCFTVEMSSVELTTVEVTSVEMSGHG